MTIQPIQNSNNTLNLSPSLQNKLNAVDAKAIAAPTPVIAGAPIESSKEQGDSVEISSKKDKKKKKMDTTLLMAFGIGIAISTAITLLARKFRK